MSAVPPKRRVPMKTASADQTTKLTSPAAMLPTIPPKRLTSDHAMAVPTPARPLANTTTMKA